MTGGRWNFGIRLLLISVGLAAACGAQPARAQDWVGTQTYDFGSVSGLDPFSGTDGWWSGYSSDGWQTDIRAGEVNPKSDDTGGSCECDLAGALRAPVGVLGLAVLAVSLWLRRRSV